MSTMKKVLLIGGGATLLLLSILFGAFFAGPLLASAHGDQTASSTPTTKTTTNAYCQQYLQDLAKRLGVSVSTLEQDQKASRSDVIDQMVKDGKLTQSQANTLKQRIASNQPCTGKKSGWNEGKFVQGQFLKKYLPVIEGDVAKGLNLTTAQLTSDLQSGKSLTDIATAQKVSATQLKTIVTNAAQDALNQAVKAGDLTQTQANNFTQMLQKHPQMLDRLLNMHLNKKHLKLPVTK